MKSFILYLTLVIFSSIKGEALTLRNIDVGKVSDVQQDAEDVDVTLTEKKNELDHVGMTKEAAELRSQYLRNKKPFLRKKTTVSKLLFPGLSPEDYLKGDDLLVFAESVESKNTNIPYDFYKLPVCPANTTVENKREKRSIYRKNLGQRLMGYSFHPTNYEFQALVNKGCTQLCQIYVDRNELKFLEKIVRDRYRIHFTLDGLPVVMRSSEDNYVVRGFPVGFVDRDSSGHDTYYLYNHLRFTVYYNNREAGADSERRTLFRITGFDVHPVSIAHEIESGTCDPDAGPVLNDPESFLPIEMPEGEDSLSLLYSYEVTWVASDVSVSF
jgi:transmembrane 9 superfamily protein 2/4